MSKVCMTGSFILTALFAVIGWTAATTGVQQLMVVSLTLFALWVIQALCLLEKWVRHDEPR